MAIDTRAKRVSSLGDWQPLPFPDGVIDQGDRQATVWVYSGVLATAASTGTPSPGGFPHGKSRLSPLRSQPPRVVQTYAHANASALALLLMDAI